MRSREKSSSVCSYGVKWRLNFAWPLIIVLCIRVFFLTASAQGGHPEINKPAQLPRSIVYGGDENFPPYEYLDRNGQPAGFNIDLIRAIARAKGFRLTIKLLPWKQVMEGLQNGSIDVAAMYRSSQRVRIFDFAIPHELVYHELFIRTGSPPLGSLSDLANKRILVEGGTYSDDMMTELGYGTNVIRVKSEPEALRLLASGVGDVAIVTQAAGRPFHQERGAKTPKVSSTGPPVLLSEYAFVTRKGRRHLIEALNEGIVAVKASGEYDRLYNRWLRTDRSDRLVREIGWTLAGTMIITLLVIAWNHSLRRRVAKQTQSLRESEERFRRAIVDAPFPIMLHAEGGDVLQVSHAWSELSGYSSGELTTTAEWAHCAFGANRPLVQQGIDRLYTLDHRVNEGDYFIRTRSGDTRIWTFSSSPMGRLPDGRRLVISMAMDVTERRAAEKEVLQLNSELEQRVLNRTAQLETANKELEAFSYSVSHDLRGPLRGIDGWAQILLEDYGSALGEEGRQTIHRLQSNVQRMGALIEDLLRLARLSRQPLTRQTVAIRKLVNWVWKDLCTSQPSQEAELVLGELPDCQADESLITQVFVNLLGNARKFSSRQPHPRVEVGSQPGANGECVYFVKDNGVGFEPQYANKLFGAFQRLHSAQEFPGTGIGLAIVHRIILRHGGRIWAEGAVGQGAAFYFALPNEESPGKAGT